VIANTDDLNSLSFLPSGVYKLVLTGENLFEAQSSTVEFFYDIIFSPSEFVSVAINCSPQIVGKIEGKD
jgi:hypothetical protein